MKLILDDNYRLPSGKPMAVAVEKLFALQGKEVLAAKPTSPISLVHWTDYFTDKLLPYYLWHCAQGWKFNEGRLLRALPKQKSLNHALFQKAKDRKKDDDDEWWLLGLLGLLSAAIIEDMRSQAKKVMAGIQATTSRWVNVVIGLPGLSAQERRNAIAAIFSKPDRPRLIGEDESLRAFHFGMIRVLQMSKYRWMKTWITRDDEMVCPICRPLHNVTVPLDQSFASLPTSGQHANIYTIVNAPPAHPGPCRCRLSIELVVDPAQYATVQRELVGV